MSALGQVQARPKSRKWWLVLLPTPVAAIALASWWFTEPLTPKSNSAIAPVSVAVTTPHAPATLKPSAADTTIATPALAWPKTPIDGPPAKTLLLDVLLTVQQRLEAAAGYTATFRKQERVRGKLGAEQTLDMKVRHQPFSIYLKFLAPKAGKEVVYCEGAYDNEVIAHSGDWTRRLIPRLKVKPDDPLALADSRHPVTDAGLLNLTNRLVNFRRLDIGDDDATTLLDWETDDQGRAWPRSIHTHTDTKSERPFARVDVLYQPDTFLPRKITSYDWPTPRQTGELLLAEKYTYDDVDLEAQFSELDFDPANPAYEFTRF